MKLFSLVLILISFTSSATSTIYYNIKCIEVEGPRGNKVTLDMLYFHDSDEILVMELNPEKGWDKRQWFKDWFTPVMGEYKPFTLVPTTYDPKKYNGANGLKKVESFYVTRSNNPVVKLIGVIFDTKLSDIIDSLGSDEPKELFANFGYFTNIKSAYYTSKCQVNYRGQIGMID